MLNVEDIYPLSPIQETLLASAHLGQVTCVLTGTLDLRAFEWAWQQVLKRHSILRTSFVWKRMDKPLQVVNRQLSIAIQTRECQPFSEEQLNELRREELAREIDPLVAPLARVVLCCTSELAYLILTYHPLILDEQSVSLLLREVLAYYASAGNGRSPQLPPSNSFWSYVSWVKEQDLAGAKCFWDEYLKDFTGQTPLAEIYWPGDMAEQPSGFDREVMEISKESLDALAELAARLQMKLDTLIQGAWALLLNRESGDNDLIYGYTKAETPVNVLGPLRTTLPVRVRIDPYTPASSWIKSFATQLTEVLRYGFYNVHEQAFQSVVADQMEDCLEVCGSSLKFQQIRGLPPANTSLVVNLPQPTRPQLIISYDRNLFARESIQRLGAHFQTLLAGLIANPEQPVLNLPLLTTAEEKQLAYWNQTATTYPCECCIHHLFEQQAEARPAKIAVICEDRQLTYAALNQRANQLAHYLRLFGVQPEMRIALCVERSLEMLVGILGILKAGAAYAPIDPAHPLERLSLMLEDLQAPVVLTQQHLLEKLPAHCGQAVCLDSDWETISLQSTANPNTEATAETLAYVMYTSGSTGTPKGVSVSHRAVVRLVQNTNYAHLGPDEVFLQFAPLSFDASTFEIWGCLLNGGRLAVMPPLLPSLDDLGAALRQHGVTTLFLTTGLFHLMIDERLNSLRFVRQLLVGGDTMSLLRVKKAFQGLPDCRLINGYGPTEGTTFTCCYTVKDPDRLRMSVPIGQPIANTQAFVLDKHLRPAPVGVTGELYVCGDGLARGYHNRPDLTAERFVPSTQGSAPGARLYQIGDLVRHLHDGNIQFLGRRDLQVKIRGFRIELGEVEAALSTHPALRDAVVVARADTSGEKQLVAYLVSREGKSVSIEQLRDFLRQKLPEHLMPKAFVELEALPLTPNGKVDRKALPAAESRRGLGQDFVAPRTEVEDLLATIWSQALGVDQVGIDDNFFSLGGDSLRGVQVLAKVQERGLSLSLQDLFQYQTIRKLALIATTSGGRVEPTEPFELITEADRQKLPLDVEAAYPLTMLQAGMIFHTELNPEAGVYHDIFSHHVRAPYDPDALRIALESLAQQHTVLRTSFAFEGFGEPLQLVQRRVEVPLHVADLRNLSSTEQDQFLREHLESIKKQRFDWSQAPLFAIELHRRSNDSFQFTISFHHAILDGWSFASLLTELFRGYVSLIEQSDPSATVKPLVATYRDYVALERRALGSDKARHYWKEKLSDTSDRSLKQWLISDVENDSDATIHNVAIRIAPELTAGLRKVASLASVPLKSVLLAAHLKVMSLLTGGSDVITGLVTNGRPEQDDGDRLLGLFLNTVPFRQQIGRGTWIDLVQQTFWNEWEALPHRWYPLAQMQREQGGAELFETAFNFTHFHVTRAFYESDRVELIDIVGFARTNIPFFANFNLGWNSTELHFSLDADGSYVSNRQARSIADYYLRILMAMAAEPESSHAGTSLLSDEERRTVLFEWNHTRCDYSIDRCVHELFAEQAARTPEAIAVVYGEERISYRELNARANQLAHRLVKLGVGPEQLVGVYLTRSVEMVIALLGILKAGGAYVPIDPVNPRERISFILQDTQVRVLLTQQQLLKELAQPHCPAICLDSHWTQLGGESQDNLTGSLSPENLAYVIHTSGSTGQPKGVMIAHRGLVNYLSWATKAYRVDEGCGSIVHSSISFDLTVTSVFAPLLAGKSVLLVPESIEALAGAVLENEDLSLLKLTPTHLKVLTELLPAEQLAGRTGAIVLGGEALLLESLEAWRKHAPSTRLINEYGPTETVVGCGVYEVSAADEVSGPVPIGKPIANARLYVLDQNCEPMPVGVVGELYIGGAGVGRGYWRRPDLTAERFVPDHLSSEAGARLYRTGDKAFYLADGQLVFLGRLDQQVKIRGFRVELGEIESVLSEHDSVSQAVVVCEKDDSLVAYLVPAKPNLTSAELREYVSDKLPHYMVPSVFVLLPELPLTPSGKVDRRALATEKRDRSTMERSFIAPRDMLELQLAQLWEDTLGVRPVGVTDNFFELGGHSILGVRLMAQIKEQTGKSLPLALLMQKATIEALAKELRDQQGPYSTSPLVAIRREGSAPAFFCVHPAGGNVLCYEPLGRHLEPGRPFYAFQARGLEEGEEPFVTIEAAASFYLDTLRAFQPEGPYFLGGWSVGGLIAFEMSRILRAQGEEIALLTLFDSYPFQGKRNEEVAEEETLLSSALRLGVPQTHLPELRKGVRGLKREAKIEFVLDYLRDHHLLLADHESQARRLLTVYNAYMRAARNYSPQAADLAIKLFRANKSPQVQAVDGWTSLARKGVEVRDIFADHFSIMREPEVIVLAEQLNELLQDSPVYVH